MEKEIIKLTCVKHMFAHWGDMLIVNQEYVGHLVWRDIPIITDYVNYWKYTTMVSQSITWIRKGWTQETLHQVIPGYKGLKEISELYTKKVNMPFVSITCSDGHIKEFCLLTDEELYNLGSDIGRDGKSKGKPCFVNSVYRVDEYFDYISIRRESKLKDLGI